MEKQVSGMLNQGFKIMKKVIYGKQDEIVPAKWLLAA